jgi:hypothetical protein
LVLIKRSAQSQSQVTSTIKALRVLMVEV